MKNLRVKYQKLGNLKFISHLDTVRLFDRAARRSSIPIVYSKGFNPKPGITFAHPLSVGISSECEYAQFDLDYDVDINEFINKFNSSLPNQMKITDAKYTECKKSLMAMVGQASYIIGIYVNTDISKQIENLLQSEKLVVTKKSKGKENQIDIKPLIYEYKIIADKNTIRLELLLGCGSVNNLNPQLIVDAITNITGSSVEDYNIHRKGLYKEDKTDLFRE